MFAQLHHQDSNTLSAKVKTSLAQILVQVTENSKMISMVTVYLLQ